jgi:uncharacterized protein
MTILLREYAADLQLRDDETGRTLVGLAVPYGVPARIGSYTEIFRAGAFADAATHPLTAFHPKHGSELPIGVSVELRDEPDGLHGAWHVSKGELGDQVVSLAADGVPLALSVGFIEGRNRWTADRSHVDRLSATLDHVAVVGRGAYPGAGVVGVRGAQPLSAPLLYLARRRHP